jgi:Putative phosphatase regulatory subunit.
MAHIQLLTVENTLSRKKNANQQVVVFLLAVENIAYDKQVDVLWAGRDGIWRTLTAKYQGPHGDQQEFWQARLTVTAKSAQQLPGSISFALRLRCDVGEFWDNNQGWNYKSRAGSGVVLHRDVKLQNLGFKRQLEGEQQFVPVKVAVDAALDAESVILHWTSDHWRTAHNTSTCLSYAIFFRRSIFAIIVFLRNRGKPWLISNY